MKSGLVRLYGTKIGHGSWSRVTAGLLEGLFDSGIKPAVHYHDDPEEDGYGQEPVAIYVGSPGGWGRMKTFGEHKERWVVLAPNSSWLPPGVVETLRSGLVTGVLAPSVWAAVVIRDHVGSALPVRVVHHGVSENFHPGYPPPLFASTADLFPTAAFSSDENSFTVLHMTSSARQRKGTNELLIAWQRFYKEHNTDARPLWLTIVSDYMEHNANEVHGVSVVPRVEANSEQAQAFYRRFTCVCQPSRAEGFGLVPLEALACGVPTILTNATGHQDYLSATTSMLGDAVIQIACAEWGPIDDGPGALAPVVDPEAIECALERMLERAEPAQQDARMSAWAVRERWRWSFVLWRSGITRELLARGA